MITFANEFYTQPWFYFVIIVIMFAVIGIGVFFISRFINRKKKEEKPSDDRIAEENLKNYLEDVDDPETKKQFEEYEKQTKDQTKKDDK